MSDEDLERRFRKRFRAAREAAGKRQEDVADDLGVSQQTVAKLEGEGQRKHVGLNEAARYARVVGVPLESLLGFEVPAVDKETLERQHAEVCQDLHEEHEKYAAALKAVDDLERQLHGLERQLATANRVRHEIETQISLQGVREWQLRELLGRGGSSDLTAGQRYAQNNWQPRSENEGDGQHQEA